MDIKVDKISGNSFRGFFVFHVVCLGFHGDKFYKAD